MTNCGSPQLMLYADSQLDNSVTFHSYVTFSSSGFPEHMPFGEFRRRFDILATSQHRNTGPVLDEKKVGELLLCSVVEA